MTTTYHFALLFLRLTFSGMLLTHGIPKVLNVMDGNFEFVDPIGLGPVVSLILAIVAEVLCPLLIILGLKTRIATLPTIITMAVAAFIHHSNDPFNIKEMALLYLFGFIAIVLLGPGRFSLDRN